MWFILTENPVEMYTYWSVNKYVYLLGTIYSYCISINTLTYTVKYTSSPSAVPSGFTLGNSFRPRGYFWPYIPHLVLIRIHPQLLKRVILKFTYSSIALLGLYWVYTESSCFLYWAIQENIAPAARPIRRINSCNIVLPGRTILEL